MGYTDKEIGGRLGISPETVDHYLRRIFQRLGANGRVRAAVLYDRSQGGRDAPLPLTPHP